MPGWLFLVCRKLWESVCGKTRSGLRCLRLRKNLGFSLLFPSEEISDPTDLTEEIYKRAVLLLGQVWKGEPIRHLGIQGSGLAGKDMPVQGSLFQGEAYEKRRRAEMTVDRIRQRYGADAVKRAAFLDTPIDQCPAVFPEKKEPFCISWQEKGMRYEFWNRRKSL